MLTESQCITIENALTENVEPRKVAAYLCLHMGLSVNEAIALRISDIDFESLQLHVDNVVISRGKGSDRTYELIPNESSRVLSIPSFVVRYIKEHLYLYPDPECFIVSGDNSASGPHLLQNVLFSINTKYKIGDNLTPIKIRQAFIRRCIQSGVDLYTISIYTGIKQVGEIQKNFSEYLVPHSDSLEKLGKYTLGYVAERLPISATGKRMNLLILGAGSQGHVVKELAESDYVFDKIDFLDDNAEITEAIDVCDNYKKYVDMYPIAIPSFGDCKLRAKWIERLEEAGFILPTLVHPMATISPSAFLDAGVTVEAKAIVATNAKIGKGCIISSGAIIDPNATIEEYCHIDSSSTIKKDARVKQFSKVKSGDIFDAQ